MSESNAANLIGINYREVPPRRLDLPIVDAHCHIRACDQIETFAEAARLYGIKAWVTMTPLEDVEKVRQYFGDRVIFNAVPSWKDYGNDASFRERWLDDLTAFKSLGARLCKFWMAPKMRKEHGLTLDHPFLSPVIARAIDLDFLIMVHVGDPTVWWEPGGKYHDDSAYGTLEDQVTQLRWLLREVAPRPVIAAHMAGNVEHPLVLRELLASYENLYLDTSAAKWMVREVSRHPDKIRGLVEMFPDRILFGTDLVVSENYSGFDHYASRCWVHQMLWETDYKGLSPIEDPDGGETPVLHGTNLPDHVLGMVYRGNAERMGLISDATAT